MFVIIIKLEDLNNILLPGPSSGADDININTIGLKELVVDDTNPQLPEIHIRVYQRKSRKYVTTIEGLPLDLDLKHILKYMKKNFSCNGVVKTTTKNGVEKRIIQISGDQRDNIEKFFIKQKIAEKGQIKIHGF